MQLKLKHQGFTLTEVLIAMVVLTIGLLGLSAMTIATTKGLAFSKRLTTATILAQDKIEEIKRANYAGITAANYPSETPVPGYPQFKRTVTISPSQPVPDTTTVIVTTSWGGGASSSSHAVTIRTIVSR